MFTGNRTIIFFILYLIAFNLIAQTNNSSLKDTTSTILEGKIISKKGNTVVISFESGQKTPGTGQEGILSLFFEETLFGMKTTGWMDIGEMKVISVKATTIALALNKELSIITKNGQKVNHFKPDKLVRFTWKK